MDYKEIDTIVEQKDWIKADQLVTAFTPLILSSIQKYYYKEHLMEELLAEGKLLILESMLQFDATQKVPFNHYIKIKLKFYYLKKNREREHLSLQHILAEDVTLEDLLVADDNTELEVMDKEQYRTLYDAVNKLSPRQRELIKAYYWNDCTMEEIAQTYGISIWTCYSTKRQALQQLKKYLSD